MASRKATILLCTVVLFGVSACSLFFEYPEAESEASAATCQDGIDNDLDGRADCYDSNCSAYCKESNASVCSDAIDNDNNGLVDCEDVAHCAGFCPELSAADCSDGVDNDGDTISDANDPGCWPIAPPVLRRCADRPRVRFIEPFDGSGPGAWFSSGKFVDHFGEEQPIVTTETSVLYQEFLGFRFNTTSETKRGITNLGSATAAPVFVGSWSALKLSFDVAVPVGTAVRVALVPEALAEASAPPRLGSETALVALGLDNTLDPPVFTLTSGGAHETTGLPAVDACSAAELCNEGFRGVRLKVVDGAFEASLAGSEVTLSTPLRSAALPPSRLVLWGGSWSQDQYAGIDNLDLRIGAEAPCGFPVPQIPGTSCALAQQLVSVGHSVSMARDAEGEFCALTTATTQSARQVVSS